MSTPQTGWTKVQWPYNSAKPYCDWECWQIKDGPVKVILYPGNYPKEGWSFVVVGAYSGFIKKTDLADAQREIEERLADGRIC